MTVLVLGRSGQVARELAALPGMRCMGREAMDLRAALVSRVSIEAFARSIYRVRNGQNKIFFGT